MEGYDAARRIRCNPELTTNPVSKRLETRAMLAALPPYLAHQSAERENRPDAAIVGARGKGA
jgi:hypothetical protein